MLEVTENGLLEEDYACFVDDLTNLCHGAAKAAGWWDYEELDKLEEWKYDLPLDYQADFIKVRDKYLVLQKASMMALIHSEVSEALEGVRKGLPDSHLPHRSAEEVELADALIRIFDYAGGNGLDLGGALVEKLEYNSRRLDHTKEVRQEEGVRRYDDRYYN